MLERSQSTTLLQQFCELLLYSKVILKSMKVADDTFSRISECEWVKESCLLVSGKHFSYKFFQIYTFAKEYLKILWGFWGSIRNEWIKHCLFRWSLFDTWYKIFSIHLIIILDLFNYLSPIQVLPGPIVLFKITLEILLNSQKIKWRWYLHGIF